MRGAVVEAVDQAAEFADEIASMRRRLETSRGERDLNRGFGGLVDVEFLVQLYQIKYGKDRPAALGSDEAAWAQNRRAVTVVR